MRRNYVGKTPRGGHIIWGPKEKAHVPPTWEAEGGSEEGVIWANRDITPWRKVTVTDFVPYIWLGGGERGLAWFGENDRGWIVDRASTSQIITREKGRVILRIYLIDKPTIIKEQHNIIFGFQASPTRPMPKNWRANVAIPSHSGPVNAWGSFIPADKYPVDHDFSIVDKILAARKTGKIDEEFFIKKNKTRSFQGAKVNATLPWLKSVLNFAGMAKNYSGNNFGRRNTYPRALVTKAKNGPIPVYFEEHSMDALTPEWELFQDEWGSKQFVKKRWEIKNPGQGQPHNIYPEGLTYTKSYRDFALWYANKWLKRGVSLYFDNTFPKTVFDPIVSEAYKTKGGQIQPACTIWEQRKYYERVWNLMNYWKEKGVPYPLTFTQHMTNTSVLPFNTWDTADLDNEWRWFDYKTKKLAPFPWAVLLAEMTGRQTGSYGHALYPLGGIAKSKYWKASKNIIRREWGMRVVHEILRWLYPFESYASPEPARTLEKRLYEFGYGTKDCQVYNYWADDPVISVSNENIKWLVVSRKKDKKIFLVLQSWLKKPVEAMVTFNKDVLGFMPGKDIVDVETQKPAVKAGFTDNRLKIYIPVAYGTRVVTIGNF